MYYSHFFLQWWTSTHVKFISTQCASSLFSSSAWVSSCCCYPRTGTSASSSSAQSCANVTSQLRAAQRRVLPQGSTGEGEPGPPCQHLHIDSMKHHDTMQTHHTQTEGGRHTLVSILGRVTRLVTCPLFHAAPWVKKGFQTALWPVTFHPGGEAQTVYHSFDVHSTQMLSELVHGLVMVVILLTPKNDQV